MNAVERKVIGSHGLLTNVSKLLKSCAGSIMATINLPHDFREFLKSLGERYVEYLLIGGYAVAYHGYPRATADIDIWIAIHPDNAVKTVETLKAFGFDLPQVTKDLFLKKDQLIRMGMPPMRIEIATTISGVSFNECWAERIVDVLDGVEVNIISLKHLKINKQAAGRHKDLDDLENLP
jgi:predicted nucleotidyltransferase